MDDKNRRIFDKIVDRRLETGDLLIFETGAYSDRDWHGPVRVKAPFSTATAVDQYLKSIGRHGSPGRQQFIGWLIQSGYVEDAGRSASWYLGAYDFDPE